MTTTTAVPPARHGGPARLARAFLIGGVAGTAPAALVVGAVVENVPLFVTGLVLPAVSALLVCAARAPRRARETAVPPRTALAMVESLEAAGGADTDTDVAVRFDLTVAPDDTTAYRIALTEGIHRVDLVDYRPRGVVVVQYPPDRPWQAKLVRRPTPEWEERAASADLDSAPESARVRAPAQGRAAGFLAFLGLLLGVAATVLPFRANLFDSEGAAQPPAAAPSVSATSSTSSTTVVTSATGTLTVGPDQSLLDAGALRRAVDALVPETDPRQAVSVVVQERSLSVVFAPSAGGVPQFAPRSLPYERLPALVAEATTALGTGPPRTWQLTAERLSGPLTIRITVTGPRGTASLETDDQGSVVRRDAVR